MIFLFLYFHNFYFQSFFPSLLKNPCSILLLNILNEFLLPVDSQIFTTEACTFLWILPSSSEERPVKPAPLLYLEHIDP